MRSLSEAFLAQAASDMAAYNVITLSTLPISHRLHYLQMWLEKLCKAHVLRSPNVFNKQFEYKHKVVAQYLPKIIAEHWRRISFKNHPKIDLIRDLCREIDLLHPQPDDNGQRPDNVEYPWFGKSGDAEVPAHWPFPLEKKLHSDLGKLLLKAASSVTSKPVIFIQ